MRSCAHLLTPLFELPDEMHVLGGLGTLGSYAMIDGDQVHRGPAGFNRCVVVYTGQMCNTFLPSYDTEIQYTSASVLKALQNTAGSSNVWPCMVEESGPASLCTAGGSFLHGDRALQVSEMSRITTASVLPSGTDGKGHDNIPGVSLLITVALVPGETVCQGDIVCTTAPQLNDPPST